MDRYGAGAIIGNRAMTANEVVSMNWARSVVNAYRAKMGAQDRTKWVKDNPELEKLLDWAAGLARDNGRK